jgi:hypothetical protein
MAAAHAPTGEGLCQGVYGGAVVPMPRGDGALVPGPQARLPERAMTAADGAAPAAC